MTATVLTVSGKTPRFGERVFLAPQAVVVGDVSLADDASVFYGACLRGDRAAITVGRGTNLQDNTTVHVDAESPCTIGEGVSVGHGAVVHGCTVGDHVLIGMNATILSGAVVGEETLIAAGSVVMGGAQMPPRSLVAGAPATVKRSLRDDEIAHLHRNAQTYLDVKNEHLQAIIEQKTA